MALSKKQELFCIEYLVDLNATKAYKRAGYSVKSDNAAGVEGSKLLRNPKVEIRIKELMKEREKRTEITQDKVIKELAKIGFADVTDFAKIVEKSYMKPILDKDGNTTGEQEVFYKAVEIVETESIPLDKIGAIAGIKQGANGIEIKTNDKVKALELLGKHLGMFTDNIRLKGDVNTEVTIKIGGEDYGD